MPGTRRAAATPLARRGLRLAAVLATAWLTACAAPTSLRPGTSETEVRRQFGAPSAVVPIDGGRRLQYRGSLLGQQAYMVDLDAQGRVVRAEQVLTDEAFGRVRIGQDTRETVLRDFGTPSRVTHYRSTATPPVWLYKYQQLNLWPMLMAVYFDERGVVTRLETGPDPDFDRGGDRPD